MRRSSAESCCDERRERGAGAPLRQGHYCAPFEQNGWVYDDGALSIAAQKWLDNGGECETEGAVTGEAAGSDSEPTRTVTCERTNLIDCALLHHVRRAEAMAYIAERQRDGDVQCDDGTPLGELGVP